MGNNNQPKNILNSIKLLLLKIKKDGIITTLKRYKDQVYQYFLDLKYKLNNLAKTNFELGLYHFQQGNLDDAIFRFHVLNKFFSSQYRKYLVAEYYLGRCYLEKLKYDKAKEHITNYLNSADQDKLVEAQFCLQILENNISEIRAVPYEIIAHNFNIVSSRYNSIFFDNRSNPPQRILFQLLKQAIQNSHKPFGNNILDLGCGTGILGTLCRQEKLAANIVGVDVATGMLNKASEAQLDKEPIYNITVNTDALSYLNDDKLDVKYDVVILSNFITYSAYFVNVLERLNNITTDQALIAISFRISNAQEWEFVPRIEQFWYNPEYILKTSNSYGWHFVSKKDIKFIGGEHGLALVISKVPLTLKSEKQQVSHSDINDINNSSDKKDQDNTKEKPELTPTLDDKTEDMRLNVEKE